MKDIRWFLGLQNEILSLFIPFYPINPLLSPFTLFYPLLPPFSPLSPPFLILLAPLTSYP